MNRLSLTDIARQIGINVEDIKLVNPVGSGQPGFKIVQSDDPYDVSISVPAYGRFTGRVDFEAEKQDNAYSQLFTQMFIGNTSTPFDPAVHYIRERNYRRQKSPLPGDEKRAMHFLNYNSSMGSTLTILLKFYFITTDNGEVTPGTWSTY